MAAELPGPADAPRLTEPRLESWKEIAEYLKRHVTTVRRWEKAEGLPVHRHVHGKLGTVYAFPAELEAWRHSRRIQSEPDYSRDVVPRAQVSSAGRRSVIQTRRRPIVGAAAALSIVMIVSVAFVGWRNDRTPFASAGVDDTGRLVVKAHTHPAAYQEYVIGRYHLWRDSDENLQRAIAHFERATEIDPQYAAAYASLAQAWWKRGLWSRTLVDTETPARAAARRALKIDDSLPDAYVVMADLERLYGRDLDRAEELVKRALALDPNHVDGHYTYGLLLMTLGRFDDAIMHMQQAAQLDPLSPAIQSDFGRVLYRARRYEEAITHLNRSLELEPRMGWLVHHRLAAVYEQLGQYDRAITALRRAGESGNRSYKILLARVLARMGNHREAKHLLQEVAGGSALNEIAAVYVALGEYDAAFTLLFDQLERGDPGPNFVAVDPPFDRLRTDPRWQDLVRRMGPRDCDGCGSRGLEQRARVIG